MGGRKLLLSSLCLVATVALSACSGSSAGPGAPTLATPPDATVASRSNGPTGADRAGGRSEGGALPQEEQAEQAKGAGASPASGGTGGTGSSGGGGNPNAAPTTRPGSPTTRATGTTAAPGKTSTTASAGGKSGGGSGGSGSGGSGGGGTTADPGGSGSRTSEQAGPPTTVNTRELNLGPSTPGILPDDDYAQRQNPALVSPDQAAIPQARDVQRYGG